MSSIAITVAIVAAIITGVITWLTCRQQSVRKYSQLDSEKGQLVASLSELKVTQEKAALALDTLRSEHQVELIDKQALQTRLEASSARLSEQHEEVAGLKLRIEQYENDLLQARQLEGQANEQTVHLRRLQAEKETLLQAIEQERAARTEAEKSHHELQARLEEQQRHNQEALRQLHENKTLMKEEFNNLANEIFDAKGKAFSEQHKDRLETLLKPFSTQLNDFRNKVEDARKEEHAGRAALKQQLETLRSLNQKITDEASNLAKALKGDKKLQGNWGELQVEQILEKSGLRKGEEYAREASFKDDEGQNKRPDFVVYLPEKKHLIIDSKVSLVDYMSYVNAEDDSLRDKALAGHIQSVRNHIKGLSEKGYAQLAGIEAPDFIFMFMPIEPAFMVAFQHDQKLFNDAFEQRIVVVTPTTLLATLRTVANLWTIERQNTNAKKLADRAGLLYDKLRVFVEKMERLDNQMTTARGTYDDAMNTLKQGRGNLISQANEFMNLGIRVKKEMEQSTLDSSDLRSPSPLEVTPQKMEEAVE
ncbi:DNA recombination protein RmuC [Candidatus Sororendozoicomonas aggregata]|uniref:DNA recombination protein RmuC n=1 Tax=Candidatus Sororendozoicomonas aggregata TaxID=3073239 RepID=UPI002ED09321